MSAFSITATDLKWIDDSVDSPEDLCLHGHAVAVIGERKLEYDATVSATALYLLKSLTEDHIIGADNQMLPCCGHFMIPDKELRNVTIMGCANGIDWAIRHENENVILETEDGYSTTIPIEDYKKEVFRFADSIRQFYDSCSPKIMPEDEFEKSGYIAFWNEWNRRRYDANSLSPS